MAEKEKSGLIKWFLGAAGGIVSGIVLMYATGFINSVVKPPKPVPNFKVEIVDGLTIRLQNLTPYHNEGWWDFGDGSPLEPVTAEQQTKTYAYRKPGSYTVKMSLHNILGEEGERAVPVHLTEQAAVATASAKDAPRIIDFSAVAINEFAPATFKVKGTVENAKWCVWNLSDGHMGMETSKDIDKTVIFEKPGRYAITLAAFDGTQGEAKDLKYKVIDVKPPPAGSISAVLNVTGAGTQVETKQQERTIYASFPTANKENTVEFNVTELAEPGYTVAEVRVKTPDGKGPRVGIDKKEIALDAPAVKNGSIRDLRLALDEKNFAARLTGKLTRNSAKEAPPVVAVTVLFIEQKRIQTTLPPQPVANLLAVPVKGKSASVQLKLPASSSDWVDVQRKMSLELKDGDNRVAFWQDLRAPSSDDVTIQGRRCKVTATPTKDAVEIMLQAN